ncbi:MAG: MerR family transcriptional regulator [Actinomycetota bacterium]|jgi:DNA-binding transcriptional MerR regulator
MSTRVSQFTGKQICKLADVTYRQLDYWIRTELISSSVTEASGSGSKRSFSYGDLLEVRVIKSLIDAGVSLARTRQAVTCLRESLGMDLGSASLVLAGTTTVMAFSEGEIVDLVRGGQGVFNIVPLPSVVSDLDQLIQLENDGNQATTRSA